MKATSQTIQQIERALRKIAAKYPLGREDLVLTDIHLQVKADSGELLAFNDDDEELTRCVVEQWMDNGDEDFYEEITPVLRQCIQNMKDTLENLSLLKPYSFVLVDEDKETLCDLYLVDDETVIVDGELLKGLDEDLDDFLKKLLEEYSARGLAKSRLGGGKVKSVWVLPGARIYQNVRMSNPWDENRVFSGRRRFVLREDILACRGKGRV